MKRAAMILVFVMLASACGEPTPAAPTPAEVAAGVGAEMQSACDEAIAVMTEDGLTVSEVDAISKSLDLGPFDPWVRVEDASMTINDAHRCPGFFEPLRTLGFSAATFDRMNSTTALDGELSATAPGWVAYWGYHPDNGLDIIIEAS